MHILKLWVHIVDNMAGVVGSPQYSTGEEKGIFSPVQ